MVTKSPEAKKRQAALKCAKKLEQAKDALWEFHRAALDCGDPHRADDSRVLLAERCGEYACWLSQRFEEIT